MFAQKPDLKFIATQHVAHEEVVRAIIAQFRSAPCQLAGFPNDDLVGIQQTRQLNRNFFPTTRRSLDLRGFCHIRRHSDAHAAKELNAFRNRVHQLNLLIEVFVEQGNAVDKKLDPQPANAISCTDREGSSCRRGVGSAVAVISRRTGSSSSSGSNG